MRGLRFIHRVALKPRHFKVYGSNLLYFFNFVATTSKSPALREAAREMASHHIGRRNGDATRFPPDPDADDITQLVLAGHSAEKHGLRDRALKARLRRAAEGFRAEEYLWFDPLVEPPPDDVPEACDCGAGNERGRKRCRGCRRKLSYMTRYRVWCLALTTAYSGESYGVRLGASYAEVLRWLPYLRPYRGPEGGANHDFYDAVYAISHLVYTLNDYGRYRLSPAWLPEEFEFLSANLSEAIARDDPDMAGEFLDSLLAFGRTHDDPVMRPGVEFLLSCQNRDGSWGDRQAEIYARYHATWAALDGLREYDWRGEKLRFPEVLPWLEFWAKGRKSRRAGRRKASGNGGGAEVSA